MEDYFIQLIDRQKSKIVFTLSTKYTNKEDFLFIWNLFGKVFLDSVNSSQINNETHFDLIVTKI